MKIGVTRFCSILTVCGALLLAGVARADDASPWAEEMSSALRLIGGGNLQAGVEIKMPAGWHTYWRYPGDSGVPPRFDFSGSDNVASVQVLYPAPQAFTDETGTTIGYKDDVIFPLHVVPQQNGKPVTLRAKIDYAVCAKLCVPVEARAALTLGYTGNNAALAAAEARVPKQVSAADAGLTVRRAKDAKPKPIVFVDLGANNRPAEIFVEGPSPDWALPVPKPAKGVPAGHQQFIFEWDGLPPGVDPKAPAELTFTIVNSGRATEVKTRLD